MNWKQEYIPWYRLVETVLGDAVPHLSDQDVTNFVSNNHWLIIPTRGEDSKQDSKQRSDANLYFSLSDLETVRVGLVCNTLESVRRLRNLLHNFHSVDKQRLIHELHQLRSEYRTRVLRKWKRSHMFQTPTYEQVNAFPTHLIDENNMNAMFRIIDEIMIESDQLMHDSGKSWRIVSPVVNIAYVVIPRSQDVFTQTIKELRPPYQLVLQIKTCREIKHAQQQQEEWITQAQQLAFKEYIILLNQLKSQGKLTSTEWRTYRDQWWSQPTQRDELITQLQGR